MSDSSRFFSTFLPVSSLVVLAASTVHAAELSGPIDKSLWATNVPSYIEMFIAVPNNLPANPPILVNVHSCGNSAAGQWGYAGFAPIRDAMESVGFIMIVPQQSRNCWDVGSSASLTNGGGGDTGAIVQMVQYALDTYNGDPTRVYVMGGSSGGMMSQALLGVYPEVFKAGHARAGVPAGCWAENYDDGQQWSSPCANGTVNKTAQQWGDLVRAMNPSYTGPRPRIQIAQGNVDETVSFNNFGEAIKEWTNVLGLPETPTATDMNYQGAEATYNRQFWNDACGYTVIEMWEALNMGHSMGYESVAILQFFGLDQVRDQDPWDAACGDAGSGGTGSGGTGGMGGTSTGVGGTGAASTGVGGTGATSTGVGGTGAASTGVGGTGAASTGVGGTNAASTGVGGTGATSTGVGGASTGAGGGNGSVAATGAGGTTGAVASGAGGSPETGGNGAQSSDFGDNSSGGCSCLVASSSPGGAASVIFLGLGFLLRRRRAARRT